MVSLILIRPVAKNLHLFRPSSYGLKLYNTKTSKPLRILFCGSDEFSIASLRAIHAEHKRDPDLIKSIDVLCRPGKPVGRSLKQIREVPIKAVAQDLGLPLHERDTFTGWDLPKPNDESINLIIAVSFGLFVPRRILKAAEYGGLNVHPSLLPNYRGPAPLQHMIMRREKTGGVTLQTLDDESFDHGKILAQEVFPLEQTAMTYQKLLEIVMPKAADILVSGLQNRLFVPPLVEDTKWQHMVPQKLVHAAKITPIDRKVYWHTKDAAKDIPKRQNALGRLWTTVLVDLETPKRLILEDSETVKSPDLFRRVQPLETLWEYRDRISRAMGRFVHFFVEGPYIPLPIFYVEDGSAVIFRTPTQGVRVKRITLEGKEKKDAAEVMRSIRRDNPWELVRIPQLERPAAFRWAVVPKAHATKEVATTSEAAGNSGSVMETVAWHPAEIQ
ncbi:Methionyl-tRNA formyltransferase [Cadophora gregata]|uniref:Methionyl-tRNA formyltransferase n=1 Tax=Cadophora gregata TaxID=51156 RepID=UPI0026DD618B|nr:Methionyl-tRNA formyltransferase [Cadophora gregata]KAK0106994.1 Methionyl-tRNA formyltransferase [Cadophora gregata]